jgi:hypothetical protein
MSKYTKIFLTLFIIVILLPLFAYSFVRFGLSQDNISYPAKDHAHFRLQYIYRGKMENFADAKYQTPYDKGQCDASLAKEPIHLHDNKNQVIHLHWARITGGEILKNYGLNLIGGQDDKLGYQLYELTKFKITPAPIFGKVLPQPENADKLWVYSGEKDAFKLRSLEEFKNQDLEKFFGATSQERLDQEKYGEKISFFDSIKVLGHGDGLDDIENKKLVNNSTPTTLTTSTSSQAPKTEEELKQINNLLGNVVIFVQTNEPTQDQVKKQFDMLEPLSLSTCGG